MRFCLLALTLLLMAFAWHPFHVAVTDIRYNEELRSLEVIQKIFSDDLAEALHAIDSLEPDYRDQENSKPIVEAYLREHLQFFVNGKEAEVDFLGYEFEEESWTLYCYLEIKKVRKLESLRVNTTILSHYFEDQENIVHLQIGDEIDSKRLKGSMSRASFVIE